jgi:hypothetical protein
MAEDLIPDLPAPWIFDSYRRMWDGGNPNELWQARAVNPLTVEEDERGLKVDYMSGLGTTLAEARDALLDAMKAPKPDQ